MYEDNDFEEYAPWLALAITFIGGAMRIFLLNGKGLWVDETFSIWLANHNLADMLHWIATVDEHPPLYYLLLHYWVALFGNTAYYVRLLSVVFSTATIPVIYLIGKRLSGSVVGLAAAAIFALSPFNIRYAQETRMYTLLVFNVAVAIYALVRLLTDSRSTRTIGSQFRDYFNAWRSPAPVESDAQRDFSYKDMTRSQSGWRGWLSRHRLLPIAAIETDLAWVVFIVFSAATLLSHNTAVFFLLAVNIFVLGLILFQRRRTSEPPPSLVAPSIKNWVIAQAAIFILWSPWMVAFIRQSGRVLNEFWIPAPNWMSIIQTLGSLLNEAMLPQSNWVMLVWILYAVLIGLGLFYFRKKAAQLLLLVSLAGIPILGELIVSLRRPILLDRTLIWITIPLFLLVAAGLAQLRFRLVIILTLGVLVTVAVFSAGDYYRYVQKEDWADPAGFVANFAEKGDLVLFNATWAQIPFDYYFKTYEDLYSIQVDKHGAPVDLFDAGILEPKMTENDVPRLESLLEGHKRVWLIYSHNAYTDPQGIIQQTLASKMKLIVTRDYYGNQLQFYVAP